MPRDASLSDRSALRVLVVAPTPYFADRGCHVRIYEQAHALRARGVEARIATYPLGRDMPGIPTTRTLPVPWYRKLEAGPSAHKVYIDALLLGLVLREIRRFRPHVLHAHLHEGAAVGIAARAVTRVPVVFDIQGGLADEMAAHGAVRRDGTVYRALHAIERRLYRRSDALIVNSDAAVERLRKDFGITAGNVFVVPDAVDCDRVRRADGDEVRASLGLGAGPVIAFLGVMAAYQGVDLLIDALPRILAERPDARVLLMGFPDDAYRRRVAAAGLGHAVRFTGRVAYEDVARHLSAADVFVSPKQASSEGNGKLLSYMAIGRPIVAFDTPVNREILGDAGTWAKEISSDALADALLRALDEPPENGAALRARAEEMFSWRRAVEGALDAYDAAMDRRAR
jgi:glycosyltransferase involved in cell wall biosynthesis